MLIKRLLQLGWFARLIFIGRREAGLLYIQSGREGGGGNVSRDQEREEQQRMLATNLNLYWSSGVLKHAILSLVGDGVWMLSGCVECLAYIWVAVQYVNEELDDIKHQTVPPASSEQQYNPSRRFCQDWRSQTLSVDKTLSAVLWHSTTQLARRVFVVLRDLKLGCSWWRWLWAI